MQQEWSPRNSIYDATQKGGGGNVRVYVCACVCLTERESSPTFGMCKCVFVREQVIH